jgi:protein-S-isoprenylcysteine O-methyltransferase Ste14
MTSGATVAATHRQLRRQAGATALDSASSGDSWSSSAGITSAGAGPGERAWNIPDLFARVAIGGLFLALAVRIAENALETGRLTGVLLLASELLVVALTIVRRPATAIDRSWGARTITTVSILGPPLLRPILGPGLVPDAVTAPISAVGLLVVILGKLALGRSFGLIPAHRGLVTAGPYGIVRHPIYLGYLITHVAFLAAHPTAWNLAALFTADLALMIRAGYEERTLQADPRYVSYQGQVRWRVVPGVF